MSKELSQWLKEAKNHNQTEKILVVINKNFEPLEEIFKFLGLSMTWYSENGGMMQGRDLVLLTRKDDETKSWMKAKSIYWFDHQKEKHVIQDRKFNVVIEISLESEIVNYNQDDDFIVISISDLREQIDLIDRTQMTLF